MEAIAENVRNTIKKAKREGTTGMSIDCLFQCTSTKGVTVPVGVYRRMFEECVPEIASKLKFNIYKA
jgi:hypothetical protein